MKTLAKIWLCLVGVAAEGLLAFAAIRNPNVLIALGIFAVTCVFTVITMYAIGKMLD